MRDHEGGGEEEEGGQLEVQGWAAGQMPRRSQGLSQGLGRETRLEKRGAESEGEGRRRVSQHLPNQPPPTPFSPPTAPEPQAHSASLGLASWSPP